MLSEKKIIQYLRWLEGNQRENADEKRAIGNHDGEVANIECARVAGMLIDMIEDGEFDE